MENQLNLHLKYVILNLQFLLLWFFRSEGDVNKQPIKEVFKFFLDSSHVDELLFQGSNTNITASPIEHYLETSPYINRKNLCMYTTRGVQGVRKVGGGGW